MAEELHVLHAVGTFLSVNENWCAALMRNVPGTRPSVAASQWIAPGIAETEFELAPFLLRRITPAARTWERACNAATHRAMRLYPAYLAHKSFANGPPRLLHSHFGPIGWTYRRVARRLRIPHVVSFYGYDFSRLPTIEPRWRGRYSSLFAEVDAVTAEGEVARSQLIALGCPEEKLYVTPLGVAVQAIPFRVRTRQAGEPLRLLQIASYVEKKGHDVAISAFARAFRNDEDVTLTFIGGDPENRRESLEHLASTAGVQHRVTFHPLVPLDQLHATLDQFDVFVHASRWSSDGDCEGGAPIVLLDAQAVGLPVVATTHCDIPAEVVDGETGWLVAENDVGALAEAFRACYSASAEDLARRSRAARSHVESHFDWSVLGQATRAVYDALLDRRAETAP